MTTPAKAEANRRNAAKSTGPRTARGKELARLNAVRHGVLTASPVIPGEDVSLWDQRRQGVLDSLAPAGALERMLAERVALTLWRLDRMARFEALTVSAAIDEALLPEPPSPFDVMEARMRRAAMPDRDPREEAREEEAELLGLARDGRAVAIVLEDLPGLDPAKPFCEDAALGVFAAACGALHGKTAEDLPETDGAAFRKACGVAGPTGWTAASILRGLGLLAAAAEMPEADLRAAAARVEKAAVREFVAQRQASRSKRIGLAERERTEPARMAARALVPPEGRADLILRYEAHLQKVLVSTLRELEQLQAARIGRAGGPSPALDAPAGERKG